MSTPRTLKLTLAYDGTDFVGWQRQAEGVSVQGLVEEALSAIEGQRVTVVGAGRTDAGVHALGQVASAVLTHPLATASLQRALNARLPADVRVLAVEEMAEGFHARYSARAKTYRYYIANREIVSPFERRYVWRLAHPLAVEPMARAARALEGRHDFAGFQAAGSRAATTVRTIFSSTLRVAGREEAVGWPAPVPANPPGGDGPLLIYEVTGEGFLRHMVRTVVGTLVELGAGRREAGVVEAVLASRDRAIAGPTAPACGLWLVGIAFDR